MYKQLNNSLIFNYHISYIKLIIIAILLRIFIFTYFSIFPLDHLKYGEVSPILYQYFTDLPFYIEFFSIFDSKSIVSNNFIEAYKHIINIDFKNEIFNSYQSRYPGPFFPIILYLTSYIDISEPTFIAACERVIKNCINYSQKTYILGTIILISEILTTCLWIRFFFKKKYNSILILLFCIMPLEIMYGLIHSSDIFFYLFLSLFYISIHNKKKSYNDILFLLILALIRPSVLGVLIFYLFYLILLNKKEFLKIYMVIFLIFISTFYYLPYFLVELNIIKNINIIQDNENKLMFFNENIYLFFFYNIKLFLVKFFYLFGWHPTSSGKSYIYIIRILSGSIYLIGYLYSFKYFFKKEFWILQLMIIPVILFLYPSPRYLLPITPFIFLFLFYFLKNISVKLIK